MDINLKEITGNWEAGYALDKHTISSDFVGHNEFGHPQYDTKRTEVGEALFRLKYRSDQSQAKFLAVAIHEHIQHRFPDIGLIIPMPPSKERASQPVYAVAKALHEITGVYGTSRILRSTGGESLKNIHNRDAKIEALKGRFSVHDTITDGKWNAILIDDLFDSGASMEAACATLKTFRKVNNVYAATLTWK